MLKGAQGSSWDQLRAVSSIDQPRAVLTITKITACLNIDHRLDPNGVIRSAVTKQTSYLRSQALRIALHTIISTKSGVQ